MHPIQDSIPQKYSLFLHSLLYAGYEVIQYYPLFENSNNQQKSEPTIIYHMNCLPDCRISQKILKQFSEENQQLEVRCQYCERKIQLREVYCDSSMKMYDQPTRIDFISMKISKIQYPISLSPLKSQLHTDFLLYRRPIYEISIPKFTKNIKLPKLAISHLKYTKWLSKIKKAPICSQSKTEQIQIIKNYYHYGLMPSYQNNKASLEVLLENEEHQAVMVNFTYFERKKQYFGNRFLELEEECLSIVKIEADGDGCVFSVEIGNQICVLLKFNDELIIKAFKNIRILSVQIIHQNFIALVWQQTFEVTHSISLNIYELPPALNSKPDTLHCIQPLHSVQLAKIPQEQPFRLNLSKTNNHLLLSLSTPQNCQIYSISNILAQQIKIQQILAFKRKQSDFVAFCTVQKIKVSGKCCSWIQVESKLKGNDKEYRIEKKMIDWSGEKEIKQIEIDCQQIIEQMKNKQGKQIRLDHIVHEDEIKQQIFLHGYLQADLKSTIQQKQPTFPQKEFILKLDIKHPENSAYYQLPQVLPIEPLQIIYKSPHISNWLISTHKISDNQVSVSEICIL